MKFFLHLSKEEQRQRFLPASTIPTRTGNSAWPTSRSGSSGSNTSGLRGLPERHEHEHAPWYVVPADDKDVARLIISEAILKTLDGLKMDYPRLNKAAKKELVSMRKVLDQ